MPLELSVTIALTAILAGIIAVLFWAQSDKRKIERPAALVAEYEIVAHIAAHPVYCLASQINFARWRAMLRCQTPSPALAPHWHATGINVGLQQRRAVLCRGALLSVLVPKLLYI